MVLVCRTEATVYSGVVVVLRWGGGGGGAEELGEVGKGAGEGGHDSEGVVGVGGIHMRSDVDEAGDKAAF